MSLKHGGGEGKIFQQCDGGGGAIFFPRIREGGGGAFVFAYQFCRTTTPPPAINNEHSLNEAQRAQTFLVEADHFSYLSLDQPGL